jgi:phenylalanyl-tRNA synthetase beta chain
MRVSLKWLKEYIDFEHSPEELSNKLTMLGLEVSDIKKIGGTWENIYVGYVTNLIQHPNADRLKLATIRLGSQTKTVVCGAPNIQEGQKIALALVGAKVKDPDKNKLLTLKSAKIRGISSEGMVCSERELDISDDHDGIIVLPEDAPDGLDLNEYLGDTILEVEVTPNRPDWLSMIGIAWEVAGITGGQVKMPETSYIHENQNSSAIKDIIKVLDTDLAPRYTANLISDIENKPSPGWMQLRLKSAGLRSVNTVVDITNYVMLEYGQPLHAYDRKKMETDNLIIRRAKNDETIQTLDGNSYSLSTEDLVISDGNKTVGLAGIMGSENSQIENETRDILLESANFDFASIRRTVQRHRIEINGKRGTEASMRFEKSLPQTLAIEALKRATKLIIDLCDANVGYPIIDIWEDISSTKEVTLTSKKLLGVIGIDYGLETVTSTLKSLGFKTTEKKQSDGYEVKVEVPFWRADIKIPEDLVEEVARVIGYDSVPATLPSSTTVNIVNSPIRLLKESVRDTLVNLGLQETISYPLVSLESLNFTRADSSKDISPLKVWNRMSPEQEYLRTSLRGSLLKIFSNNEKTGRHEAIKLFEISRIYIPVPDKQPSEKETLVGIIGGKRAERNWMGTSDDMDFFDGKGIIESLSDMLGTQLDFTVGSDSILAQGRTANILAGDKSIGVIGEILPDTLNYFEINNKRLILFEIDLESLANIETKHPTQALNPISRYPGLIRELDLLTKESTPSGAIEKIIRNFPSISKVKLLDIYNGPQIPSGQKSSSFEIVWQSPSRTLTDKEVEIAQNQLLEELREALDAKLRL